MKFTIYQESRIGQRSSNQDRLAYSYSRDALLMVIADGMGGHLHGEVAAQITVEYITQAFQRQAKPQVIDPTAFLSRILLNAHHAILDYAFDKNLPEAPRTTVVACLIQDNTAWWAHAGDSRLYLLRKGEIACRTKDHSRVQAMIDEGTLSPAEASTHPNRNRIYSCLGGNRLPQIDLSRPHRLHNDDVLVLCTDGLWGPLADADILAAAKGNVMEVSPAILDAAERKAGPSCDNLSLVALHWHDGPAAELPSAVSTQTLVMDSFTTQLEAFGRGRSPAAAPLTDDEIERAIDEINAAIHKFNK